MANEIQATTSATTNTVVSSKKQAKQKLKDQAINIYQEAAKLSNATTSHDVRNNVKDTLEADYKNRTGAFEGLSDKEAKDLYKQVRKQAGFGFWRRNFAPTKQAASDTFNTRANQNQTELDNLSEEFYLTAMGDSDATTAKGVRRDVRSAIQSAQDSDFAASDKFSAAQIRENAMNQTSRGTWARQALEWTGDLHKKAATQDFETRAAINNRTQTQEAFRNGSKTLSEESKATLQKLGLSADYSSLEQLYQIGDQEFGSDATDNYSYQSKHAPVGQSGENTNIIGSLNRAFGKEVSEEEAANLYRELGYKIEPKVYTGHVVGGAIKGAAAGATGFCNFLDVDQFVKKSFGQKVFQDVHRVPVGILTTAVGGLSGAAVAANKDYQRVENAVMTDVKLPEGVKTYEDFERHISSSKNKDGKQIMLNIAKQYTNADGTLDTKGMEAALRQAAGDNSVLNYQEARALYADLLQGKPDVDEIDEIDETPCDVVYDGETTEQVEEAAVTHCYEIKKGDHWANVLEGKYNIHGADLKELVSEMKTKYYNENKERLNAAGIYSPKGAFFIEGKEWCLPETVTVNNKTYTYQDDAQVKAGVVSNQRLKFGLVSNGSVRFTTTVNETTHRAHTTCEPNVVHTGKTREEAEAKARATIK